jgi:NADH:ubiquinone reductase (non-electrogenic)
MFRIVVTVGCCPISDRAFKGKGIHTRLSTSVLRVCAGSVELEDHDNGRYTLPADVVVLTAGTEQLQFVKDLPLQKDAHGRVLTSRTLQCLDVPCVFALGDCAVVQGDRNPATAQVAMQQSYTAADNVLAYLAAQHSHQQAEMKEFSFFDLGEMVSLGTADASICSFGGWVNISGPLAALGRRFVYGARMPTVRQSIRALLSAITVIFGRLFQRLRGARSV